MSPRSFEDDSPPRAPLDLLLSFVGFFLVAFAPVSVAVSFVTPPDALTTAVDVGVTVLVAGALALPYWWTGRSVGDVGALFFWIVAVALLLGLPAFPAIGALSIAPETGSAEAAVVDAAFFAVVYAVASSLVYGGGHERLRARRE